MKPVLFFAAGLFLAMGLNVASHAFDRPKPAFECSSDIERIGTEDVELFNLRNGGQIAVACRENR